MSTRRTLVAAAIALALAGALVWWLRGRGDAPSTEPAAPPVAVAPRAVATPGLNAHASPPVSSAPALGPRRLPPPPPDFNDGGMPAIAHPGAAERALAAGEFPVRPPGFASEADRARFRAWWLEEYARRARIYREHNPADTYPSDEDTDRLLERFYDLGEPPRAGETADDLDDRQQAWFEAWSDLTAAFGAPPMTIITFGADPQYGTPPPPPIVPAGGEPPRPDDTRPTMPESDVPASTQPLGPAAPRPPRTPR
jgi:hypothetical protein